MKIGIYTDAHFSVNSSILSGTTGTDYSKRLDMLVNSFEWMYQVFEEDGVELIVNGGDLIDSDLLKAREGSALAKALSYSNGTPEIHILGNHEMEDYTGNYSSVALLDSNRSITVYDKPTKINDVLSVLPYTKDYDSIDFESIKNKVLISHIDYEGMRVGGIQLTNGVNMNVVSEYFDLVLNGHIHTPSPVGKVMNIGSCVGHSFSDDYRLSYPSIMILDTYTLETKRIQNPHSVLFLKFDGSSLGDFANSIKDYKNLPNPKCVKFEVPYEVRDEAKEFVESILDDYRIVSYRIQTKITKSNIMTNKEEIESVQSTELGMDALVNYVNLQDDDSLPAPKSDIVSLINSNIRNEVIK